jgi:hypothetical protein
MSSHSSGKSGHGVPNQASFCRLTAPTNLLHDDASFWRVLLLGVQNHYSYSGDMAPDETSPHVVALRRSLIATHPKSPVCELPRQCRSRFPAHKISARNSLVPGNRATHTRLLVVCFPDDLGMKVH